MKVRALYFASVRDALGIPEERFELSEPACVRDFAALFFARHPQLAPRSASLKFARNEAFAALEDPLTEGDVMAVIPPVAGG
jgi:molybdopterin converting factor subunit 1